jgi:quercetin dioxygenase-like cupin family protein
MHRLTIAALLALLASPSPAADISADAYKALLTPLLQSGADVLGRPLDYPDGTPAVTAAIVTLPPGAETGWHLHEVPLFAYVLEGVLTVDYGVRGTRTYRAGDSLLEAMDWPHNGSNRGDVPVRLIAVYMGGSGDANTVPIAP